MNFIGETIIGPVVLPYITWVIKNAQKQGIDTLYFLARDGYLLHKIAKEYCKAFHISVECRYLYCSRFALRLPTYHFLGEEGRDLLFALGEGLSIKAIFSRLRLNSSEYNEIMRCAGITVEINKTLTDEELDLVKDKLCRCSLFLNLVKIKSIEAYYQINSYFKQEGVYAKSKIGIVDSGWAGTMQRSLVQLIQKSGYSVEVVGFYFGLFSLKMPKNFGVYLSWYFSPDTGFWRKVLFNNNVFECMLSAPHEMTIGYKKNNKGDWEPLLKPQVKNSNLVMIDEQINGCMKYVRKHMNEFCIDKINLSKERWKVFFILIRFMVFPRKDQVQRYGKFFFSGEVSESKLACLVDSSTIGLLKNYLMAPRIKRKILSSKSICDCQWLYWAYGSAAFLPFYQRVWYILNIIVSECRRICSL